MIIFKTYPTAETADEALLREEKRNESPSKEIHLPEFHLTGLNAAAFWIALLSVIIIMPIMIFVRPAIGLMMFCLLFMAAVPAAFVTTLRKEINSSDPNIGLLLLLAAIFFGFTTWFFFLLAAAMPKSAETVSVIMKITFCIAGILLAALALIYLVIRPVVMIISVIIRSLNCKERLDASIVLGSFGPDPQYSYEYDGQKYIYTLTSRSSGYVETTYENGRTVEVTSSGSGYGLSRQVLINTSNPRQFIDTKHAGGIIIWNAISIFFGYLVLSGLIAFFIASASNFIGF